MGNASKIKCLIFKVESRIFHKTYRKEENVKNNVYCMICLMKDNDNIRRQIFPRIIRRESSKSKHNYLG
jgi:hypothetical protein